MDVAPDVVVAEVTVDENGDVVLEEPDDAAAIPDPFADVDFEDELLMASDEESVTFDDPFENVDFEDDDV